MYIVSTIIFVLACYVFIINFLRFFSYLERREMTLIAGKSLTLTANICAISFTYVMVYLFVL